MARKTVTRPEIDTTETRTVTIHWTTSRARDTYGYNVVTFRDERGRAIGRASGGGYDMVGSAFGDVLEHFFAQRLRTVAATRASRIVPDASVGPMWHAERGPEVLYGLTVYLGKDGNAIRASIDGACGINSVESIAEAMGLRLTWSLNRRGHKTACTIEIVSDPISHTRPATHAR